MTSNVRNQGIAHAAFQPGARPLCGNRRAHMSFAIADFRGFGAAQCSRCAAKLAGMDSRSLAQGGSK